MIGWIISIVIAIIIVAIIIKMKNGNDSIVSQAGNRISSLGSCCAKMFKFGRA